MTQVAFVKTRDRLAGVKRALDLLGAGIFSGKHLFLKPNFNSADPPPGSTHDDTLTALVRWLQAQGASRITVGDRSGMGDTRAVMEQKGVFRLAEEMGFDVVVFDELGADGWEKADVPGSHWKQGFALARPALAADGIVQTCCLKTHRFGGHFHPVPQEFGWAGSQADPGRAPQLYARAASLTAPAADDRRDQCRLPA